MAFVKKYTRMDASTSTGCTTSRSTLGLERWKEENGRGVGLVGRVPAQRGVDFCCFPDDIPSLALHTCMRMTC